MIITNKPVNNQQLIIYIYTNVMYNQYKWDDCYTIGYKWNLIKTLFFADELVVLVIL
jgi:hypothetical protein